MLIIPTVSPDIRYTSFWWVDISGAPDSYLHNDVSYSYGIWWKMCFQIYWWLRSPYTVFDGNAWSVRPDGGFVDHYVGTDSYGIFALRTLLEYLSGIHIQMVQLLDIMMDILIPTALSVHE